MKYNTFDFFKHKIVVHETFLLLSRLKVFIEI